ncbi:MAG: replicative DNA helicase [Bacteroidales bacterium]|nr:replicative DNA helicase [Bacteroidales bacterium]
MADSRKTGGKKPVKPDVAAISADMGRKPPQALDIEEAVLAALMLEQSVITDVRETISPDCFYKEGNKKIYEAICEINRRGDKVDILTVAEELERRNQLDEVGGRPYLSMISMKVGAASNTDYHCKILLQKYIQRELISISYTIQKEAYDDTMPVEDLLSTAERGVMELADSNVRRETCSVQDILDRTIEQIQKNQERPDTGLSGVASGYVGIDKVTYGWQPSDLIILAARPSVGKTAFVLTMARNMTVDYNIPVAIFSLEMSESQLIKRILVGETGLDSSKIWGASKFQEGDWNQFNERIKRLSQAPLWIDDTSALSVTEFRSKARRLVHNQHVKLIIIDYLQLMTGPPESRSVREQEVSAISRSLKAIAKELDVPIIALSQLSRAAETRGGNKRPQLSDLRESGAIEQDADIVMFIHRPEFIGVEDPDHNYPGYTQLIIAKHRNGSVEDVEMRFIKSEVRFVDVDVHYENGGDYGSQGYGSFGGNYGAGFDSGTGFDVVESSLNG